MLAFSLFTEPVHLGGLDHQNRQRHCSQDKAEVFAMAGVDPAFGVDYTLSNAQMGNRREF
jgi:hypothetical protein